MLDYRNWNGAIRAILILAAATVVYAIAVTITIFSIFFSHHPLVSHCDMIYSVTHGI